MTRTASREPESSERVRAALGVLRWTSADLARACGVSGDTVERWARGRRPVPCDVLAWLERRAAGLRDDPAPDLSIK